MAPSTKLALANSLKNLLQKKFLEDITVKELVEDCQVNRQTFYYHFQDIYDLLRWLLDHESEEALRGAAGWREALLAAFRCLQDQHMAIYHIYYSSAGRDHLTTCPFHSLAQAVVRSGLEGSGSALPPGGDRDLLLDFYVFALSGIMAKWFAGDMREPPEELADRLSRLLTTRLRPTAEPFAQPSE